MEAAMGGIGIAMPSPQMPTVGAGSSQREDSPARPTMRAHHAPRGNTIDGYGGGGAFVATWRAASRLMVAAS